MAAYWQKVKGTGKPQELEEFLDKLKDFQDSLGESVQAMLDTILEGAFAGETGCYFASVPGSADNNEMDGNLWTQRW